MEVDLDQQAGCVTVSVRGELDLSTTPRLRNGLAAAFELGDDVVLDLSGMSFVDSTGMHAIVVARREADRSGLALSVTLPTGPARQALDTAGFTALLRRAPTA